MVRLYCADSTKSGSERRRSPETVTFPSSLTLNTPIGISAPGKMRYEISAFVPISLSVQRTDAMFVPIGVRSLIVTVWLLLINSGELSFSSIT